MPKKISGKRARGLGNSLPSAVGLLLDAVADPNATGPSGTFIEQVRVLPCNGVGANH